MDRYIYSWIPHMTVEFAENLESLINQEYFQKKLKEGIKNVLKNTGFKKDSIDVKIRNEQDGITIDIESKEGEKILLHLLNLMLNFLMMGL